MLASIDGRRIQVTSQRVWSLGGHDRKRQHRCHHDLRQRLSCLCPSIDFSTGIALNNDRDDTQGLERRPCSPNQEVEPFKLFQAKRNPAALATGFRVKTLAMTYSRMLNTHYHRRVRVSLPSSGWDREIGRAHV